MGETKNSVKSQLAPNSNSNKVDNDITKEEFDSWATDLLSNKVPDKSAVVKQGVQSLNLDDNDWGETDWGDNSFASKSHETEDDKKKQREEKRLQRQKEIEAKRAAKKGPLKLGAKKQTQADPDLFWGNSHEKNNVEMPAKLTPKAKLIFDIFSQDE